MEEAATDLLSADRDRSDGLRRGDRDGLRAYFSYWAEDGALYPAGRPTVRGREEIMRFVFARRSADGAGIRIRPLDATVASSGDLGYTLGTYELEETDVPGDPESRAGRYLAVWRRGPQGGWRCTLEIHNPVRGPER